MAEVLLGEEMGTAQPLRRNGPVRQYTLGAAQLGSSLAEKDLRALVDAELNIRCKED